MRRTLIASISLVVAAAIWLPCVRFFYRPAEASLRPARGVSGLARSLARRHLWVWTDPRARTRELERMRRSNAEWDFMGRTYLVLALANLAAAEPSRRDRLLGVIDEIIGETLRLEEAKGQTYFLMPYAKARPFVARPARSLFVDGEIAIMLEARRMVREDRRLAGLSGVRVAQMADRMRQSPVLSAESYPDECWTFCNSIALAAIRMHDHSSGSDHSDLLRDWVRVAKRRLVDPETGILISSYTLSGQPLDGPEGSSIFMAAHMLQAIDPAFARDQWSRARRELARGALGFAWAAEWPRSWTGPVDVDSGPTVPLVDANAGSSGMALVGAAAFEDHDLLAGLVASLDLAAFPVDDSGGRRYAASNQVGDAALLYALVQGPLFGRLDR